MPVSRHGYFFAIIKAMGLILLLIRRRPFIALTLLYCTVLIALNYIDFFDRPSGKDVSHFVSPLSSNISGIVAGIPEQKGSRVSFILNAEAVNGQETTGRLLVNYYLKNNRASIEQGESIALKGKLLRPPAARNPGGFDYAKYLRRKNIYAITYTSYIKKTGGTSIPPYYRLASIVRKNITDTINKYLPQEHARILIPMLVGDNGGLTREDKSSFTDAGVMHILVVSGLNVGYVVVLFLFLFRTAGFKRRHAALSSIPFIILYMVITGNNPPVVRATVMALSIIISLSLARDPLIYQSLALAAAAILAVDPQALFTASFQLSFAATIGIVYLYPYLMAPWSETPRWLKHTVGSTISVSIAAQLAVIPLIAYYFNKISVSGILSNILIVPLAGIITAAGLILYGLHFISSGLASIAGGVTSLLLQALLYLVRFFAKLPFATEHVATPGILGMTAYYALLFGIFHIRNNRGITYVLLVSITVASAAAAAAHFASKDNLTITSLYAGNGTCVHIAFPRGEHWLVDTGRELDGEKNICPYLWSKGIRSIDKIIITSSDKRHNGGLRSVAGNFPVSDIVYPHTVPVRRLYFVDGSTLTVVPQGRSLTVLIDYSGKTAVLRHEGAMPDEMFNKTADILHLACSGKTPWSTIPGTGIIVLSGTPPKEIPGTGKVFTVREYGAVSAGINPQGISIHKFKERQNTQGNE